MASPPAPLARPPHIATGTARRRSQTVRLVLAASLVVGWTLGAEAVGTPTAAAAPGDGTPAPGASSDEVSRLQALVDAAQATLGQATVEAEATADMLRTARTELTAAQEQAASTAAALDGARQATVQAEGDIADLAREAFMNGGDLVAAATLLESTDPGELIQRSATMDILGEDRAQRLESATDTQEQQQIADQAARDAVTVRDQAVLAAQQAETQAAAQLAQAQAAYDGAEAERQALEEQLQAAQLIALSDQGVADPEGTLAAQQRAGAAAASAGSAALVDGRVTSCYGNRGGTMHYGIDIAAPIGTPIYAPEGGRVIDAGPASGFGLAVYLQHPDGTVTVYGHINDYFVTAGQTVSAGDVIAEVGNTGQSTGPHLHIETHTGGLYANRVNPVGWLAARGITLGGTCG